jgi:hypothetical protein
MKYESDRERSGDHVHQAEIENESGVSVSGPGIAEKRQGQEHAHEDNCVADVELQPAPAIRVQRVFSEVTKNGPDNPQHGEQQRHDAEAD